MTKFSTPQSLKHPAILFKQYFWSVSFRAFVWRTIGTQRRTWK